MNIARLVAALHLALPAHSLWTVASHEGSCTPNEEYPEATLCPHNALTNCHGGHHGFGNQYSLLVGHYIYARVHSVPFCFTPWTSMDHGVDAGDMFEFVGGPLYGPQAASNTTADWATREPIEKYKEPLQVKFLDEVRRMYFSGPKPDVFFEGGGKVVVWHWRQLRHRLNVEPAILSGLRVLRTVLASKLKAVHFVSKENLQNFPNVTGPCGAVRIRCHLQLGRDLQTDFHAMVRADVLVVSRQSTLSAMAGALNKGLVYLDDHLATGRTAAATLAEKFDAWQQTVKLMLE